MALENDLEPQAKPADELATPPPSSRAKEPSLFQRLFGFLFGAGNPEYEKRRLLKEIARELRQTRFKFYKLRIEAIDPNLARFFFEIYKVVGPAQALVKHADSSGALKTILIESFLSEEGLKLREHLSEEAIRQRAQTMPLKELASQLKDELVNLFSIFDSETVRQININYNLLNCLVDIIQFDYYFMLKKFDTGLPENNFLYTPHFEPINAEYIVEDLKEYADLIAPLDGTENWDKILDLLKEYRNVDIMNRTAWKKAALRLRDLNRSRVLLLMIRHIEKDPYYRIKPHLVSEKIVESYLSKLKTQTELTLQKIAKERHTSKVEELCKNIFGTSSISRLKNYSEKANTAFSKKMLGGYIYVQPLNYLKAFLLDYLKKDIRELIDLLIIKGKWTSNIVSQQLSESFHVLIQISDRITTFDDSVAEETQTGAKLRIYLHKFDKDKQGAQKVLRQMLKEINDQAKALIHEAAQHLINIGKNLKSVIDDFQKSSHELIINWKEIEFASDKKLAPQMVIIYKKIYYLVKLLQIFIKED